MNFFEKVYDAVRNIPKGKVASYGYIAKMCGVNRGARQVGWALHVNPDNGMTPCHRVVTKDGRVSQAFKFGGENVQITMLEAEGVEFVNGCVDMERFALK